MVLNAPFHLLACLSFLPPFHPSFDLIRLLEVNILAYGRVNIHSQSSTVAWSREPNLRRGQNKHSHNQRTSVSHTSESRHPEMTPQPKSNPKDLKLTFQLSANVLFLHAHIPTCATPCMGTRGQFSSYSMEDSRVDLRSSA